MVVVSLSLFVFGCFVSVCDEEGRTLQWSDDVVAGGGAQLLQPGCSDDAVDISDAEACSTRVAGHVVSLPCRRGDVARQRGG